MTENATRIGGSDGDMRRVSTLAVQYLELEAEVKNLEGQLKAAQERFRRIRDEDLPDAMHQAGLARFMTTDGAQVELKPQVTASWPGDDKPDRQQRALDYLRSINALDLVSCDVVVSFAKTDHEAAAALFEQMRGRNDAKTKMVQRVHPQSLAALVRERLKNGQPVDFDALNVHSITRATVK